MSSLQGYQGNKSEREETLNDRLNKATEQLQNQVNQIDLILSRIFGSPPAVAGEAKIRPPSGPMSSAVAQIENSVQRFTEIVSKLSQVA